VSRTPLREALDAFVDSTQGPVTGSVRLKLYKGNIISAGRQSPFSLYREDLPPSGRRMCTTSLMRRLIHLYILPLKVLQRPARFRYMMPKRIMPFQGTGISPL
jgi:argininosuccinate synthase